MPQDNPEQQSNFKLRVYCQAFAYFKRKIPKKETQVTESGIVLNLDNWYDEVELKQLATNYNGLMINEDKFNLMFDELKKATKQELIAKGILI